jgi:hypothetical protein
MPFYGGERGKRRGDYRGVEIGVRGGLIKLKVS